METRIRACDCTGLEKFQAGSGSRKDKPYVAVPFHTRQRGAEFQDQRYGRGLRLHNLGPRPKLGPQMATCTVCGRVKPV